MTAIVGLRDSAGNVWLGSDSAALSGWEHFFVNDPKSFVTQGIGIAYTTDFRFGHLLRYGLKVPPIPRSGLHRWLCLDFVDAVRACLTAGGWLKTENGREEAGAALLAVRGRLFVMHSDLQVQEVRGGFEAHGCGRDFCVAALEVLPRKMHPRQRILKALRVAAKFSAGVSGPFRVIKVPRDG